MSATSTPPAVRTITHEYAFAVEYKQPTIDREKTATVRHGDERRLVPGDEIVATTPDGEPFARLTVDVVARVPLELAPSLIQRLNAQHPASTPEELKQTMNQHYDPQLSLETPVRVIVYTRQEVLQGGH